MPAHARPYQGINAAAQWTRLCLSNKDAHQFAPSMCRKPIASGKLSRRPKNSCNVAKMWPMEQVQILSEVGCLMRMAAPTPLIPTQVHTSHVTLQHQTQTVKGKCISLYLAAPTPPLAIQVHSCTCSVCCDSCDSPAATIDSQTHTYLFAVM